MDCSTPGLPVLHCLPEFIQTHVLWVGDAIQLSHHLLPPSFPALNLSKHQDLSIFNLCIKPKWTAGKNLFLGCQVVKSIRGGSFLPVGTCSSSTSCYFCDSSYSERRLPKASELASGRAQLRPVVSPSRGALASPHVTGDSGRVSGIAICANSSCATFWEKPEPIKANMGSKRGQQTWTANVGRLALWVWAGPLRAHRQWKALPGHLCGKSCLPPWH